jgi:dienelactone hydrolase
MVLVVYFSRWPAAGAVTNDIPGDNLLNRYWRGETEELTARCLTNVRSLDGWTAELGERRRKLAEMLGLWPMPERTPLKPVVTGRTEHDTFVVENVQFQSLPGFYVTANLYRPREQTQPLPTILYLCGHGAVISNGVSYGNKVTYQHHGVWFARNGYVCLIVDSVQLGELQGLHHGTYRENMWWWNSRGYTPAGAEAWNCIRALDYLSTRPEVDTNRFGATGRSGGGAYTWWAAALDERIKVAVPVAGITDLHNHVVDGVVEGHCDCMFMVNTYRWDYPEVAALIAPRPLLIVNTDADSIFPLDGVQRLHAKVRAIYKLHKSPGNLGLVIGPGPHKDTQDLQVPAFRWFNRHLKADDPLIESAAVKLFTPSQLKVFEQLPPDAVNTNIHETLVPMAAEPSIATSATEWSSQSEEWLSALKTKSFAGWPPAQQAPPASLSRVWSAAKDGLRLEAYEFLTEHGLPLRAYVAQGMDLRRATELHVTVIESSDDIRPGADARSSTTFEDWLAVMSVAFGNELKLELESLARPVASDAYGFAKLKRELNGSGRVLIWIAPRGVGLTAWTDTPRNQIQQRRRFMMVGQTLEGMRVWDIRQAVEAVRAREDWRALPLTLRSSGWMACNALYASLFAAGIERLELGQLPRSHRVGPDYLNVLKVLDIPQALAMAVERGNVTLQETDVSVADFAANSMRRLGWKKEHLQIKPQVQSQ